MHKAKNKNSFAKVKKHLEKGTHFHSRSIEHLDKARSAMEEVMKGNKIEAKGEKKLKKHLKKVTK